jgi:hypothetical protein
MGKLYLKYYCPNVYDQKNRVKDIFNNLEIIRGRGPGGSMS